MSGLVEHLSAIAHRLCLLRCPTCHAGLELSNGLTCKGCERDYYDNATGIIRLLPDRPSPAKEKIQSFWGDIYRQWYESEDYRRNRQSLESELELLEDLFRRRRHLAVTEISLQMLAGKELLEIGCGSGAHSALFRKYGAHVTSADISLERVASASRKLYLIGDIQVGSGLAIQADAESLPFVDNAFDIVYSNGVLHHTEDTRRAVREVFRVLKPGGEAAIMLYSRYSANFLFRLVPLGIITGQIFGLPEEQWLGRLTEGRPQHQAERNPITRVFSRRQIERMFEPFERVYLRKNGFLISHFPIPGIYRDKLMAAFGAKPHDGGRIVYGKPMIPESKLELWLGRIMGFCWNIKAIKGR